MKREKYLASTERYNEMKYNRMGTSSVMISRLSLGLWHNFGSQSLFEKGRQMIYFAFDRGINHFDLANNYGPAAGTAELNFGRILREGLMPYRDEIMISTKAGHEMWEGPLGGNSSRKHLIASIDQSLRRMGLEYVDIFYTHRYDGVTPIAETAQALIDIVRSGRALYIGVSKYPYDKAAELYGLLSAADVPCLVSQYRYSLFERSIETEIIDQVAGQGAALVAFSPLAQGLLTERYIGGIPADSRAAGSSQFLTAESITAEKMEQINALNAVAQSRGEKLSQMALAWALRDPRMTSLIIGASSNRQIEENIGALDSTPFTADQLAEIDKITLK